MSTSDWVAVYACIVVSAAFCTPSLRPITSTTGVMLLVVQLAQEKIRVSCESGCPTPWTAVAISGLFVGAEITTCFEPASRCALAF